MARRTSRSKSASTGRDAKHDGRRRSARLATSVEIVAVAPRSDGKKTARPATRTGDDASRNAKGRKVVSVSASASRPRRKRRRSSSSSSSESFTPPLPPSNEASSSARRSSRAMARDAVASVVTPCTASVRKRRRRSLNDVRDDDTIDTDERSDHRDPRSGLRCRRRRGGRSADGLPPGVTDVDRLVREWCPSSDSSEAFVAPNEATASYLRHYGRDHARALFAREREAFSSGDRDPDLPSGASSSRDYMSRQPHLSPNMRALLVDWFFELTEEYHLQHETLHLAVSILDRVLNEADFRNGEHVVDLTDVGDDSEELVVDESSDDDDEESSLDSELEDDDDDDDEDSQDEQGPPLKKSKKSKTLSDAFVRSNYKGFVVKRNMLQCVGCACLLLASKLVDKKHAISVKDMVYISDATYTCREIVDMEAEIARRLSFRLFAVTAQDFFHRFALVARFDEQDPDRRDVRRRDVALEHTFRYLSELALLEYGLVSERPSRVAAAALYLAKATTASAGVRRRGRDVLWTPTLEHHTGHSARDLEPLVRVLHQRHAKVENDELRAAFVKYSKERRGRAALRTVLREDDLGFGGPVVSETNDKQT